jgi:hypothetical protein
MDKKKPEPKPSVFKRQILRSANAYTDDRIEELLKLIELSEDTEPGDGESGKKPRNPGAGQGDGSGGGGLGVVFPPDIPTPWIIPRPPVRDVSDVGKITSIKFQELSGEFTYDTDKKYGGMYLSSDGSLTATVTVEIDGEGEIEDYEIQVTKID